MIKGPLGSWIHDYLLEPAEHGVTLVNKIAFAPPGGMLGMILTEQRLRDQLEEGYHHRNPLALKKRSTNDRRRRVDHRPSGHGDCRAGSRSARRFLYGGITRRGPPGPRGKLIEEAYELVRRGLKRRMIRRRCRLLRMSRDVIFHLLVFLQAQGVEWRMVERELTGRFGVSGC